MLIFLFISAYKKLLHYKRIRLWLSFRFYHPLYIYRHYLRQWEHTFHVLKASHGIRIRLILTWCFTITRPRQVFTMMPLPFLPPPFFLVNKAPPGGPYHPCKRGEWSLRNYGLIFWNEILPENLEVWNPWCFQRVY